MTNYEISEQFIDDMMCAHGWTIVGSFDPFNEDLADPVLERLLNFNKTSMVRPYRPIYTELECCEECNGEFDAVSERLLQFRKTDRSWKNCPTDVSFECNGRVICLMCVTKKHGIKCSSCKKKYLYMDSFFYDNECKSCYIKARKGCAICFGFVNKYTGSKLCTICKSDYEMLDMFTKHMMTDRDIKFYRKMK